MIDDNLQASDILLVPTDSLPIKTGVEIVQKAAPLIVITMNSDKMADFIKELGVEAPAKELKLTTSQDRLPEEMTVVILNEKK